VHVRSYALTFADEGAELSYFANGLVLSAIEQSSTAPVRTFDGRLCQTYWLTFDDEWFHQIAVRLALRLQDQHGVAALRLVGTPLLQQRIVDRGFDVDHSDGHEGFSCLGGNGGSLRHGRGGGSVLIQPSTSPVEHDRAATYGVR
jgi:hypothetical protein